MSETSPNPKSPRAIKGPGAIRRENYSNEEIYLATIRTAETNRDAALRVIAARERGRISPDVIMRASSALTREHREIEEAQARHAETLELFRKMVDIFQFGVTITVRPFIGGTLNVMRWGGSEYYERHEVERVLQEGETFEAHSIGWDPLDGMLKAYNTSIAGDTKGSWVELSDGKHGPEFEVVSVELPEIIIEGEERPVDIHSIDIPRF